jgi:uncharacterized protein (TIGR02452 family)
MIAKSNPVKNHQEYGQITKNKIRLMLSIPAQKGVKNVILGAWGCGVFRNDPTIMASYFKEILINEGYSSLFERCIFAIIGKNFETFNQILA